MRLWQIALESMGMLVLWIANACSDILTMYFFHLHHHYGEVRVMLMVLGAMHVYLNCWILRYHWRSLKKTLLVVLFFTQTVTLFLISRRAWQSLSLYFTKDDRIKKRRFVTARYTMCIETENSFKNYTFARDTTELRSCLPPETMANSNDIPIVPDPCNDNEDCDLLIDAFFTSQEESQLIIPVGTTRFSEGTGNIEQNFWSPQEVDAGEPSLQKSVFRTLQHLFVDQKKMSYHVVTDSSNRILHITNSDRHIKRFPVQPSVFSDEIHYAVNLTKTKEIEVIAITKKTFNGSRALVDADISKFVWAHVWPSAVIKLYLILGILDKERDFTPLIYLSPLVSVITWLITQKSFLESWRNVGLMIPLQLNLTVTRSLLVIGIGIDSLLLAGACYISVKAVGMMALIAYVKKVKNGELYRDTIGMYNYNPIMDPVIQIGESCAYIAWAIWLYTTTPLTGSAIWLLKENHLSLIILITTLFGHIFGVIWLWFTKSKVKEPFRDPKSVLKLIQLQAYTRTENNML